MSDPMIDQPVALSELEEAELAHHPGPRAYVAVAVILAVITAMEVAIYYISSIASHPAVLIPMLLFFALIKFVLVALYFMHLKFDSPVFKRLFVTGIVLALIVFGIVLTFFFTHGGAAPAAG
ncbi:MAG TPA: cytochrome C oxidase subunit IV family protein [Actinomycetota bacterium]|nr:cytochrome C oxidase subunit IV family protein [Actinomycetota bacterium]